MRHNKEIEYKIREAFLSILKNTSFEKTRVTEIVKTAGISHQTFYRYYTDKYDLALKIAYEKLNAFFDIFGKNATWKEIMISILNSMKNFPVLFKRLLEDPEGSTVIMNGFVMTSETLTGGRVSSPNLAGFNYILREWSRTDFKTPVETIYCQLRQSMTIHDVMTEEDKEMVMTVYENRKMDYFIAKAKDKK